MVSGILKKGDERRKIRRPVLNLRFEPKNLHAIEKISKFFIVRIAQNFQGNQLLHPIEKFYLDVPPIFSFIETIFDRGNRARYTDSYKS